MYTQIYEYIKLRIILFVCDFLPKQSKELKSPYCKATMKQIGYESGTNNKFLMCNKCYESYWVDVVKRADNRGNKF